MHARAHADVAVCKLRKTQSLIPGAQVAHRSSHCSAARLPCPGSPGHLTIQFFLFIKETDPCFKPPGRPERSIPRCNCYSSAALFVRPSNNPLCARLWLPLRHLSSAYGGEHCVNATPLSNLFLDQEFKLHFRTRIVTVFYCAAQASLSGTVRRDLKPFVS